MIKLNHFLDPNHAHVRNTGLAVLAIRLGRISRVSYNLTTWHAAHHRLNVDGHQVRLGGFHAQHPHTIDVIASNGTRLTLLVLPPATHPTTAHPIMMIAARRNNLDNVGELLTPPTATNDQPDDPAMQRWKSMAPVPASTAPSAH